MITTKTASRAALLGLALAGAATGAGCTISPLNGQTASGNVVGKTFHFQGFYNEPSAQIRLEVMKDPTLNPSLSSSWVQFATATTGTSPLDVNDPDAPLYLWEVTAAPVPNASAAARWPQGGLVRVRAVHPNPAVGTGILTTFDQVTYADCQAQQLSQGATWAQLGVACEGVAGTNAAFVSTTNRPTGGALGFLGKKGDVDRPATLAYYAAIDAPDTLAEFKTRYGFGEGITATYYNDGDLGLGREMHCKAYPQPVSGIGIACYVTNYSGVAGQAVFDQSPTTVLADAVARQHAFATVAMVADPPFNGPNSVKFMVYGVDGSIQTNAQLDSTAAHTSIPNNCLACHGINSSFNANTSTVTGAQFLPFDPFSFKYSTQAGFTYADQASAIRQLNALVTLTQPSAGTMDLITGMYAPKAVTDATAVANPDYLPAGWASEGLDGRAIYDGVVKLGCRTCHVSATSAAYDFVQAADFDALRPAILADVCGATHTMPHAERVMKNFWASGARAYLVTKYPSGSYPDPLAACKP